MRFGRSEVSHSSSATFTGPLRVITSDSSRPLSRVTERPTSGSAAATGEVSPALVVASGVSAVSSDAGGLAPPDMRAKAASKRALSQSRIFGHCAAASCASSHAALYVAVLPASSFLNVVGSRAAKKRFSSASSRVYNAAVALLGVCDAGFAAPPFCGRPAQPAIATARTEAREQRKLNIQGPPQVETAHTLHSAAPCHNPVVRSAVMRTSSFKKRN